MEHRALHGTTRWNIALFTALITQHDLTQQKEKQGIYSSKDSKYKSRRGLVLSPAAFRFITLYLAAVLEAYTNPFVFTAREAFIRIWRISPLVLFSHVKPWAQKLLKRTIKALSSEWERELGRARQVLGSDAYDADVAQFVGSLVTGQSVRAPYLDEGAMGRNDEANGEYGKCEKNELLEALMVPCPSATQGKSDGTVKHNKEGESVCDLRAAISCLQSARLNKILPVLMKLFSPADD